MNLYLQAMTWERNPDLLDILSLPDFLRLNDLKCQPRFLAGGKLHKRGPVDPAARALDSNRFNQLEATYSWERSDNSALPGTITGMSGVLTPDPSTSVWFPSADFPAPTSGGSRAQRMNAHTREFASVEQGMRRPSILELVVELETGAPNNEVLDATALLLASGLPARLDRLEVFGCVDAGGPDYFVKMNATVGMTSGIRVFANTPAEAYPDLGPKFDALHPVLFGSRETCEGLVNALDGQGRNLACDNIPRSAVVRLTHNPELHELADQVSKWIILGAS